MAFWSRKPGQAGEIRAEVVRVVKEEPYIPKQRTVRVADWVVSYGNGTKLTVKATHMSDSQSYVYLDATDGHGWKFSSDSKALVREIFFYDTVWGESDKFGQSTQRLVARVTSFNLQSVTSTNWREEERGLW